MHIKKLFPQGKTKAFNLSYDDGVLQDVRLIQLIDKYGLKATFNLNSYLMETEFEWTHENGSIIKRLPKNTAKTLYINHEVASHTRSHPYMENLTEAEIMQEMASDKQALEAIFNTDVYGFEVPFDYYSDLIERCAVACGFEYARTSQESRSFTPCRTFHRWQGTVFHLDNNLNKLVEDFLRTDEELAVFQLIGHSYDLDTANMWDKIEAVFASVSSDRDVLPITNIDLVRYLREMEKAVVTNTSVINNSSTDLFFSIDGRVVCLTPQEKILL